MGKIDRRRQRRIYQSLHKYQTAGGYENRTSHLKDGCSENTRFKTQGARLQSSPWLNACKAMAHGRGRHNGPVCVIRGNLCGATQSTVRWGLGGMSNGQGQGLKCQHPVPRGHMNRCNCRLNAGNHIYPGGDADLFLYSRCCAEVEQLGKQRGHDLLQRRVFCY
jgi:hypothetical protein